MSGVAATRFAVLARYLAAESRAAGLVVPAFRSPPRCAGSTRTIRRSRDNVVVAVALRGRTENDVVADMIEGIVVTNRLGGATADVARRELRAAVEPVVADLPVTVPPTRNLAAPARVAERQTQAA